MSKFSFLLAVIFLIFSSARSEFNQQENIGTFLQKTNFTIADTTLVSTLVDSCGNLRHINPKKAYWYARQGLLLSKEIGYISGYAKCKLELGLLQDLSGDYSSALESYITALRIYEQQKNTKGIIMCYNNIAVLYKGQKNYPLSLKYHFKVLKLAKETGFLYAEGSSSGNIANIYNTQEKYELALKYNLYALNIFKRINHKLQIFICLTNLSNQYINWGNYKLASKYLQEATQLREHIKDKHAISANFYVLSLLNLKLGNYPQAIEEASTCLKSANEIGDMDNILAATQVLAEASAKNGDYKKAYSYHVNFKEINDSIFNINSSKQFNEIDAKYQNEKKEKEIINQKFKITLLEKEKEKALFKQTGLAIISLIIIVTSIFIFFNIKRKMQLKSQLNEVALNNEKLKINQIKNELEYKNNELINYALHISEKNDFLEKLKSSLSEDSINTKEILHAIENNLMGLESEKREFEAKIEQISQAFSLKLREKFPDITKNEERLAALLRLDLSSKEIAMIFNITSQSVDTYRYRLRKKFNIPEEINLGDFLNSI